MLLLLWVEAITNQKWRNWFSLFSFGQSVSKSKIISLFICLRRTIAGSLDQCISKCKNCDNQNRYFSLYIFRSKKNLIKIERLISSGFAKLKKNHIRKCKSKPNIWFICLFWCVVIAKKIRQLKTDENVPSALCLDFLCFVYGWFFVPFLELEGWNSMAIRVISTC